MGSIPTGEIYQEGEAKRLKLKSITALLWLLNGGVTGCVGAVRAFAYFRTPELVLADYDLAYPFALILASIISLWVGVWLLTFTDRLGKKEVTAVVAMCIVLVFTFIIDLIISFASPRPFSTTALIVGAIFLIPLNLMSIIYFAVAYRYENKDIEKPLYRHPY
jgi:uncharacterized protein YacL